MRSSFIHRFISLVPICLLLVACTFLLTCIVPGDALDQLLMKSDGVAVSAADYSYRKEQLATRLGLNKPLFYFSITTLAEANAYRYFTNDNEKSVFYQLLNNYGNYRQVRDYYDALLSVESALRSVQVQPLFKEAIKIAEVQLQSLKSEVNESAIQIHLQVLTETLVPIPAFRHCPSYLSDRFLQMQLHQSTWKQYIPVVNFYADNQFHSWFWGDDSQSGILGGYLGVSYYSGKPVLTLLKERIGWSLFLTLTSVLIAYATSIPLAAWLVYKKNKWISSFFDVLVSLFYAIPVYLMGVALLFLFSNPEMLNLFPSSGVRPLGGFFSDISWIEKAGITCTHLCLPLICYTYATFAFLLRTQRSLLEEQMKMGYIKTANAKGLHPRIVVFKHALKNAVLPLASVFTQVFPAVLGGSVIIESLFSIPGIGLEVFNAAVSRNYPVIAAVFMLTGILTLFSFMISDFIVSRLDPRIPFTKS